MSASPSLNLIVGIVLPADALKTPTGRRVVCGNGHERRDAAWIACPLDGTGFTKRDTFAPSDLFVHLLAWVGGSEDRLWCQTSGVGAGLHSVGDDVVLGIAPLRSFGAIYNNGAYRYTLAPDELASLFKEATDLCRSFGVTGDVALHVRAAVSW